MSRKETEINHLKDEREDLKLKWELTKRDLKHFHDTFTKSRNASKGQAVLVSILFFLSSAFIGLGTNLLTASPPNELGWIIIAVAIMLYVIGTLLTTRLAFEGRN